MAGNDDACLRWEFGLEPVPRKEAADVAPAEAPGEFTRIINDKWRWRSSMFTLYRLNVYLETFCDI